MSKKIADWQKLAARKNIDGFIGKAGRWTLCIVDKKSDKGIYKDSRTISFHDSKYVRAQWPIGQPVSGYYVQTLLEDREGLEEGGLNLDGGVEAWSATPGEMKKVFKLIDKESKKIDLDATSEHVADELINEEFPAPHELDD